MNISFIIPVLNSEKFIRQCLQGVLSEASEGDEVIVVDNGSTDDTVKIIRSFDRVQLLIYPDITVSALRNRGASSSSNSLLAFIDADVILCENWRKQVAKIFTDKHIHASGSRYDLPEDACWIERAWYAQKKIEKCKAKYINSGNLIVRAGVYETLGGFDEKLASDEDCDFGKRLNKKGYLMMEVPDIRTVHLGNPKSLKAFYRKELWHATSVLASKSFEIFNRPTIMSILFGITLLVSFTCLAASLLVSVSFIWGVLSVLLIPIITAMYRAYQFNMYRYVPELTLLWAIFYSARIKNILKYPF